MHKLQQNAHYACEMHGYVFQMGQSVALHDVKTIQEMSESEGMPSPQF